MSGHEGAGRRCPPYAFFVLIAVLTHCSSGRDGDEITALRPDVVLHDCAEIMEDAAGTITCQVEPGRKVRVIVTPLADPAVVVLAVVYPNGTGEIVSGPRARVRRLVWYDQMTAPGEPLPETSRFVALTWQPDHPIPKPPPAHHATRSVYQWVMETARRAGVGSAEALFYWRPPLASLPLAGTTAATCVERRRARDWHGAIKPCHEAWVSLDSRAHPHLKLYVGAIWAYSLRSLGRTREAVDAYQAVADLADRLGARRRQVRALHVRAHLLLDRLRSYQEAMETIDSGLAIAERVGDRVGQIDLRRLEASCLLLEGRYLEAFPRLHQVLSEAQALGDVEQEAKSHFELARLALQLGDPETALSHLESARPYYARREATRNRSYRASALEDVADFHGLMARALTHAWESGLLDTELDAIDRHYRKARELARSGGLDSASAWYLLRSAELRLDHGDSQGAQERIEQLVLAKQHLSPPQRLFLAFLRAGLALAQGRLAEAYRYYASVEVQVAVEPEAGWSGALGRAKALVGMGHIPEAERAVETAIERVVSLARQADPGIHRAGLFGGREEVFALAESLAWQHGDVERAFRISEQRRQNEAMTEAAATRAARASRAHPSQWRAWMEELQRIRSRLEPDPLEAIQSRAKREAMQAERERARRAYLVTSTEFSAWLDRLSPVPGAEPPGVSDIQGLLFPDEALLVYSTTPTSLVAYLVSPDRFRARTLNVTPGAIRSRVRTLRRQILEEAPEVRTAVAELGRVLIGPFADILPARRLFIAPTDALFLLPFHVLQVDNVPLVERVATAIIPGTTAWVRLRRSLALPLDTPGRSPLIVADPDRNLPGAKREALQVASLFERPTLLIQDDARLDPVLRLLEQASLFHYAGHGRQGSQPVVGPYLALAGGQALTTLDLLELTRVPDRVVLSGCETAGGRLMAQGILRGMATGFLAKGSRSVLASLWPLQDGESRHLMDSFYRGWLEQGLTWDQALRQAALAHREGMFGHRYARMHTWAAFVVLGDPGIPHSSRSE